MVDVGDNTGEGAAAALLPRSTGDWRPTGVMVKNSIVVHFILRGCRLSASSSSFSCLPSCPPPLSSPPPRPSLRPQHQPYWCQRQQARRAQGQGRRRARTRSGRGSGPAPCAAAPWSSLPAHARRPFLSSFFRAILLGQGVRVEGRGGRAGRAAASLSR